MNKRVNLDEKECKKCKRPTKPLFNRETYCPACEGDDEPTEPNWNSKLIFSDDEFFEIKIDETEYDKI